jgi:predicted amidophosphoribosyltransferase
MFEKRKECPQCQFVAKAKNFCPECGTDIRNISERDTCWVVLSATGTGFRASEGRYESLEELTDKAGPLSRLVQSWIVLTFVDEIKVGNKLISQEQMFVTSERALRNVELKVYQLLQ